MKKAHKRWGLAAALVLTAGSIAAAAPFAASASPASARACGLPPRIGHFAGLVAAQGPCTHAAITTSDHARGKPPLLFHGGPVMMTQTTGPLVVTPIFWNPVGHVMTGQYKSIILGYLAGVAQASGQDNNVYSVANEYFGTNGHIHYNIKLGLPINDFNPLPPSGCTVANTDFANIYADGSGYDSCLDDDQLQAEIDNVTAAHGLPRDLSHIYVLYLPKHVESCFFPGSTTTAANACTINYQPSAAYCAYHNFSNSNTVYANMPYPIYESKTHFTCGTEKNFGTIESPNFYPDADVQVSPTSHEIIEAITDPDTSTGWYDEIGFEIGDECAYVFGPTQGTPGQLYNQTIGGFHYLTQEEFSNNDFALTGGGCVQGAADEATP